MVYRVLLFCQDYEVNVWFTGTKHFDCSFLISNLFVIVIGIRIVFADH